MDVVDVQRQRVLDAKQRLNAAQRSLIVERGRGAAKTSEASKRRVGESMRAAARNDALSQRLRGATAATEEEMVQLSVTFNQRLRDAFETPSWIKLFHTIDTV